MPHHRPRNKSTRDNSQNTSRGGRGGRGGPRLETTFVPFRGASAAGRGHNGFTLQEEARNTERHHASWNTDQRLRDTRVSFVSAGTLGSTRPEDGDPDLTKMSLEDSSSEDQGDIDVIEVIEEDEEMGTEDTAQIQPRLEESEPVNSFFIDTEGNNAIQTGLPPPRIRSSSPTPSNSSEEVLLFAGRDKQGRGILRDPRCSRTPAESISSRVGVVQDETYNQGESGTPSASTNSKTIVVEEEIEEQEESRRPVSSINARIRIVEGRIHEQEELLEEVLRHDKSYISTTSPPAKFSTGKGKAVTKKRNMSSRKGQSSFAKDTEEALLADYIANIDPEALRTFSARELGGSDEEIWVETEGSSAEPNADRSRAFYGGWNRSDLDDFDDLSTSDGVMGEVQEILSKRDRHRGVQYLVVWEDQATDEARWVPATTLTSVQALAHIESFKAEEKLVAEFLSPDDEDTTDSEEIDDEEIADDDDDEEEDDDQDLLIRRKAAMSDEKLARLLAKQEAYGMGSDELLLFDDGDDDADKEDLVVLQTSLNSIMLSNQKSRGKGPKRARGDFPSATLMADAYDGFDVMDFERPSLKPKPKGRKGKLPVDLSDSELESSMQMAWENDRSKKTRKKQEREELRSQGMLGSKFGKPDMKQKYKEGMGIMDVAEEIKAFLKTEHTTTLALPPMEKADRKIVHELSVKCNLKSLSKSKGNKRAPVLTKTSRTFPVPDSTFDTQVARLTRRFLPRMDVSGKHASHGGKGFGGGKGGGFNSAAVSYRDGDIVGGSAPELGAENRGRAMLEKMGWSSGTALGALNNKGIMQPVTHVVKTTKAGLG